MGDCAIKCLSDQATKLTDKKTKLLADQSSVAITCAV